MSFFLKFTMWSRLFLRMRSMACFGCYVIKFTTKYPSVPKMWAKHYKNFLQSTGHLRELWLSLTKTWIFISTVAIIQSQRDTTAENRSSDPFTHCSLTSCVIGHIWRYMILWIDFAYFSWMPLVKNWYVISHWYDLSMKGGWTWIETWEGNITGP